MTKFFSHITLFCVVACIALCATSCDVHEFPADKEQAAEKHQIKLNLDFSTVMPTYKEVTFGRSSQSQLFDMYYHVEAYSMAADGSISSTPSEVVKFVSEGLEFHNQSIYMSLDAGTYRLHVWAHYVEDGQYDKYFVFDSLNEIAITDTNASSGNTDNADAFRSVNTIDVNAQSLEFDVPMTRPTAKYEIRATSIQDFVSRAASSRAISDLYDGKYTAVVRYTGFVPCLYSISRDRTVDSRVNLSYTGSLSVTDDDEAVLGFDYLFTNPYGGGVSLAVDIYDGDGKRIAGSSSFDVPLMQGYLTIVRGEFLSKETNGLGINSEFIGPDFNIRL